MYSFPRVLWRVSSRGLAASRAWAAQPGSADGKVVVTFVRQTFAPHTMHTLSFGQQQPRQAWTQGGAAAARELQRFARGAPFVAVPFVRRKLQTVAHSVASEEAVTAAHPVLAAAATVGCIRDNNTYNVGAPTDSAAGLSTAASPEGTSQHCSSSTDSSEVRSSSTTSSSNGATSSSNGATSSSGAGDADAASSTNSRSSKTSSREDSRASSSNSKDSSGTTTTSSSSSNMGDGTAASPARGPPSAHPVLMHSGASMLPHPEKAHRGGEDAFFIADTPLALGVADGVGGWAEVGVDAGAYARLFMTHAKEETEALIRKDAPLSPQTVLERAYYRTNVQGSSTVCILALNGTTLCASNLGDSGFVLVRSGKPAFQSPQQQHNFNFPYQLGSADGGASDHPQIAMRFELAVQPGDIIITGTDGLWDNVFAEEASTIVSRCRAQGDGPEVAANTLCRYARMRATDPKYHSPFSYAAIQAGYVFLGGKLDDITVVVSYVSLAGSKL